MKFCRFLNRVAMAATLLFLVDTAGKSDLGMIGMKAILIRGLICMTLMIVEYIIECNLTYEIKRAARRKRFRIKCQRSSIDKDMVEYRRVIA